MSFVNTDLQEKNKKLNMKVDLDGSEFQRILDKISNSDLYKNEFFTSSFQHNIYHIQRVMFFSQKKVSPFFVASINETVEITKFGQYALLGFCFYCFTAI